MESILLLNHIEVAKIDIDDLNGNIVFKLVSLIEGDGYRLILTKYNYDFETNNIVLKYVLIEYCNDGTINQTSWIFNSHEEINDDYEEFYQLTKEE